MYLQNHPVHSVIVERAEFDRRLRYAEYERIARRIRRRRKLRRRT